MEATDEQVSEAEPPADPVLYFAEHGVAVVTLNRPGRLNAWTPALGDRCFEMLSQAGRDPEVRVIVLTGAGRGFCAGADMSLLASISDSAEGEPPHSTYQPIDILKIPKPVIAAVNGAAVGIGLIYALMCDIRFAAAGAKLATGFSRIGLVAEHAASWTLQRLVGQPATLELLLSGRTFLAEEAAGLGLVSRIYPTKELLTATLAYAREMADNCSPLAMAVIKRQVYLDADRSFADALSASETLTSQAVRSPDFKEGLAAFAEKRKPNYAGISGHPRVEPLAYWGHDHE